MTEDDYWEMRRDMSKDEHELTTTRTPTRVMEVLANAGAYCGECSGEQTICPDCQQILRHYAKELADAGLLAPELPGESWPQVWEVDGFLVTAIENGGETIELAEHEGDGTIGYGWCMNRHLARKLAHALLAAAEYAEKMSQ